MCLIAVWFTSAIFSTHVIWAALYLGKPVTIGIIAWLIWCAAGLVYAVLQFDAYTFAREHLLAERAVTRAYRALQACAKVIHARVDRGVPVRGTPLHAVAMERHSRALAALLVAQRFRERRDGKA